MGKGQDFLSGFLGSLGDSANMMTQVGMMKQMFPQSGEENIAKLKATCDATEGVQWNPVTNQCEKSGNQRKGLPTSPPGEDVAGISPGGYPVTSLSAPGTPDVSRRGR